jgi:hypothetical protein
MIDIARGAAPARAPQSTKHALVRLGIAGLLGAGVVAAATVAQAGSTGIQKVTILSSGPAFGGYAFPNVGTYTVIKGYALDAINPTSPQNSMITDIGLAPRDANGNVDILFNFYMIVPTNLSQGNGKVMYEPPNRGSKQFGAMNLSTGGNDPASVTSATTLANTFLWPQGYATVFSGWEYYGDPTSAANLSATASGVNSNGTPETTMPVAFGENGATITGPGYEYIVSPGTTYTLGGVSTPAYPAYTPTPGTCVQGAPYSVLTHRVHLDDTPQVVPTSGWQYTDGTCTAIELVGPAFVANDIYEFSYMATNPTVNAAGLAGIRDFLSWLRYSTADNFGTPNPLANYIQRVYSYTLSQPARTLNDFVHLGFNADLSGRKVIDGMLQWVGAGDGLNMNYRWSQTSRTERNRQQELYLEGLFPFADVTTTDPISGTTDGRFAKCATTNTCPLAMEFWSANEYWVKAASLFTTDPTGSYDLPDHPLTRKYFLSSAQHAGPGSATSKGLCQNFNDPLDPQQVERALWNDLDAWSTKGIAPPPSQVPTLLNGTLAPSLPQSAVGFPNIPGVTYTGLETTRYRFNYGPSFYQTYVPTYNPPVVSAPLENNAANGPIYPSYVPTTDVDGNDIGGIRLPELLVPLATYMGWNLRSGVWANDGCESTGSYVAFEPTKAARVSAGDPRLSVQERYATYEAYQSQVIAAVDQLVSERFFNCSDTQAEVTRLLAAGLAAGVPANVGNLQPPNPVPACVTRVVHDFNGDGNSDLLWMSSGGGSNGSLAMWLMNGGQVLDSAGVGSVPGWQVVGQRDFTGGGTADLLFRDTAGDLAMWLMDGTAITASASLGNVATNWSIYGTGDMNGDGTGDLLWLDTAGDVSIWFMNGTAVSSTESLGNVGTNWSVVGSSKGCIIWEDKSNDYAIWLVNGAQVTSAGLGKVPSNFSVQGVGDFDGDGSTDILWRDSNTGVVSIWFLNGTSLRSSGNVGVITGTWQVAQTGDYNGDGDTDILWLDGSGNLAMWLMNGPTVISSIGLGNVGTTWSVQAKNAE